MSKLISTGVLGQNDLNTVLLECEPFFKRPFGNSETFAGFDPSVRISKGRSIDVGIPQTVQIGFALLFDTIGGLGVDCYNYPDIQFLKYPAGGFYDWHIDWAKTKQEGMYRMMSMSLTINDDYQGGGLEIKDGDSIITAPNVKGGFAIFSAFHQHRALKVDSGERQSITFWFPAPITLKSKIEQLM